MIKGLRLSLTGRSHRLPLLAVVDDAAAVLLIARNELLFFYAWCS
jgi:hypothetical protein